MKSIDLDAARRERQQPEGLPVTLAGESYLLPAEFPVDVLDPILDDDFDLVGLIRDAMKDARGEDGKVKPVSVIVIDTLFNRPSLPVEVVKAIYACFELLFGEDQYARFKAGRPSLEDYGVLTSGLFSAYGVSLGEAFASLDSSESDGATQKETSESTPASTPEKPSDDQGSSQGSSE